MDTDGTEVILRTVLIPGGDVINRAQTAALAPGEHVDLTPAAGATSATGTSENDQQDTMLIDEITMRRQWLQSMTDTGRWTAEEIRDIYITKWGKTPKTLSRDLAALAIDPSTATDATGRIDDTA